MMFIPEKIWLPWVHAAKTGKYYFIKEEFLS
jgi:hypothetical protein